MNVTKLQKMELNTFERRQKKSVREWKRAGEGESSEWGEEIEIVAIFLFTLTTHSWGWQWRRHFITSAYVQYIVLQIGYLLLPLQWSIMSSICYLSTALQKELVLFLDLPRYMHLFSRLLTNSELRIQFVLPYFAIKIFQEVATRK